MRWMIWLTVFVPCCAAFASAQEKQPSGARSGAASLSKRRREATAHHEIVEPRHGRGGENGGTNDGRRHSALSNR